MREIRQRIQQRHARWQADATHRRLFRQQVWRQRRQQLRWELHRRWHERPHLDLRRRWEQRPHLDLRRRWEQRPHPELRRRWQERTRRDLFEGIAVGRVAVFASVLLIGGVAGYAAIRSAGDAETGSPSADGTARAAAEQSPGEQTPKPLPGLNRAGVFLSVAVDDSGELEVSERARSAEPLLELSLVPPPPPDGVRGLPQLTDVEVTVDGEPVEVPSPIEVTTVVELTEPATRIDLRYQIVGAVARQKKPTSRRATLSLRPALGPMLDGSRAVVEVYGTLVRDLSCVEQRRKARACGTDLGDGWRTRPVPATSSSVVAVVRLPEPAV